LSALCLAAASKSRASTQILPDLVARPPGDVQLERRGHHALIRFTNTVANLGVAPMELEGTVDPVTGETRAYQHLFNDDGTYQSVLVGDFIFDGHQGHDHWHFADFASYQLRRIGKDGQPGPAVAE